MSRSIDSISWEYGEQFGRVYYPAHSEDIEETLKKLAEIGKERNYPFFAELNFSDGTYIGIIVGGDFSCFNFSVFIREEEHEEGGRAFLDVHWDPSVVDDGQRIDYSYLGSHSETRPQGILPKECVLNAVRHYYKTGKLPSYIQLTREDFRNKYVSID